jgi:hypothetical protein
MDLKGKEAAELDGLGRRECAREEGKETGKGAPSEEQPDGTKKNAHREVAGEHGGDFLPIRTDCRWGEVRENRVDPQRITGGKQSHMQHGKQAEREHP